MPDVVWLNGRFVPRDEAKVSAFDAGIQHGVGLFETMLGAQGRVFRVERHMARLAESSQQLGLVDTLRTGALQEALQLALDKSKLAQEGSDGRARLRLTITGGDMNLLTAPKAARPEPTVMIVVTPATPYPPELFEKGIGLVVAIGRAGGGDPCAGHKTLDYWWRLRELQRAAGIGMGECLVLQSSNHVCGGAVSNLFVVRGGRLYTPAARGEEAEGSAPSPVLPGITRSAVIECAGEENIGCDPAMLSISDVLDADEVFLTNSSWGVLPVVRVEGRPIGDGVPGEVTWMLRRRWLDAVREEE